MDVLKTNKTAGRTKRYHEKGSREVKRAGKGCEKAVKKKKRKKKLDEGGVLRGDLKNDNDLTDQYLALYSRRWEKLSAAL